MFTFLGELNAGYPLFYVSEAGGLLASFITKRNKLETNACSENIILRIMKSWQTSSHLLFLPK